MQKKGFPLWWSSWLGQRMLFHKITQGRLIEAVKIIEKNRIDLIPKNAAEHQILSSAVLIFSQWLNKRGWNNHLSKVKKAIEPKAPKNMSNGKKIFFRYADVYDIFCYNPSSLLSVGALQNIKLEEEPGIHIWVQKMAPFYESHYYNHEEIQRIADFLFKRSLENDRRMLHEAELLSASRLGLLSLMDSSLWTPAQWSLIGKTLLEQWFEPDAASKAFMCGDFLHTSWDTLIQEDKEKFIKKGYEQINNDFKHKIACEKSVNFFNLMLEIKGVDAVRQDFVHEFEVECSPSVFALLCRHYEQFERTWGHDFCLSDALSVVALPLYQQEIQFKEDQKHWEALFHFFHHRFGKKMAVLYKAIEDALRKETDEHGSLGYSFLREHQLKFNVKQVPLSSAPLTGDSFVRF